MIVDWIELGNKDIISELAKGCTFTGIIESDYDKFFIHHGKPDIAQHCRRVSEQAKRLAAQFGICQENAEIAGYLHDISRVIPESEYLDVAIKLGIEVLEEEKLFPGMLHQKISRVIARELFRIEEPQILDAIECHTTLKANAGELDMLLLVADKMSWDSIDSQPILDGIIAGLKISLENGVFSYLKHLRNNRDSVKVLHPWSVQAYLDLKEKCLKARGH